MKRGFVSDGLDGAKISGGMARSKRRAAVSTCERRDIHTDEECGMSFY
jgi:hypothetical protein